jgi:hypothetical protein
MAKEAADCLPKNDGEMDRVSATESFDVPQRDKAVSDWPVRFALRGYAVLRSHRLMAQGVHLRLAARHAAEY